MPGEAHRYIREPKCFNHDLVLSVDVVLGVGVPYQVLFSVATRCSSIYVRLSIRKY